MIALRYVTPEDEAFWYTLDTHLPKTEFPQKVSRRQGYILLDGAEPIGVLRYHLFWDSIPWLTMIHLKESAYRKGFGRQAMHLWEEEMRGLGHEMVMTSTQADEQAQHFYRALGYQDCGVLFLSGTPCDQPPELFLQKVL